MCRFLLNPDSSPPFLGSFCINHFVTGYNSKAQSSSQPKHVAECTWGNATGYRLLYAFRGKGNVTVSYQDGAGDDRRAIGNEWTCSVEGTTHSNEEMVKSEWVPGPRGQWEVNLQHDRATSTFPFFIGQRMRTLPLSHPSSSFINVP